MNLGIMTLTGLLLALGLPRSEDAPKRYWVLADTAMIRNQAKSDAPALGCFPTGTAIKVAKKTGAWVYVDSANRQAVRGWVHDSTLSDTEVDESALLKGLSQAESFADTLRWTERLVSLLPNHQAYLKALQKGYVASGDTARAARCGRRLRGTDPIYLARYDGKDLLVIGSIDSSGEFRSLLWTETRQDKGRKHAPEDGGAKAIRKTAMGLRTSLAAMEWFGERRLALGKIYFHTPKIVPSDKDMDEYFSDVTQSATFGISLGASAEAHSRTRQEVLFATRPFTEVPLKGIALPSEFDSLAYFRRRLVGEAFDTAGVARIDFTKVGEYGYVDIAMQSFPRYPGDVREQRGIFDSRRKLVWPPEDTRGIVDEEKGAYPRALPRWIRFGPDDSYPAFIVLPFTTTLVPPAFNQEMGDFGFHLLRISRTGFKFFLIRTKYAGC